ncbi:cellulose-binding domain-containing protein [Phytohabitans sp. LJ34]|uniref:cellulose-binding domain-containing protein n=1 Tax=Phytohabitans sp. LJ34 TaxID=3452217 RepID=UPI003F89D84D
MSGRSRRQRRVWPALLAVAAIPAMVTGTALVTMPAAAGIGLPAVLNTCAAPTPTGVQCTIGTPISSSSSSPSTASPSTCRVTYTTQSQWDTGFLARVTVHNNGTAPVSGWTVRFTFPGDQRITNLWNGTYVQTSAAVTVSNARWNQLIPPGGSTWFGMYGASTASQPPPTTFTLNNAPCTA